MAKNTKNLVLFKLFSEDLSIKYIFISNEDSIFNENISRLYELNPQYNYQNNYFICNDTKDKVNEYKTLKENNIKNGYLVYLILNKNSVNSLSARSGEEIEEMRKLDSMAYNLKNEKNTEVIVLAKSTKNLICLKFESLELNINCYILSDKNEIFNTIANKVFEEKKEVKEYGIAFSCNENQVNEYKSLCDNKLKDNDIIKVKKRIEDSEEDNNSNNLNIKNEEKRIKKFAEKIKRESNIDVIILAKDTKNLMTLKLESLDKQINYYILCKENEIFNTLINRVFKLQPEFRDYEYIYTWQKYVINRYHTLKKNHIKNGNTILMNNERKIWINYGNNNYNNEKKLKEMSDKLKEETKTDVIVTAKETVNLLKIKFQSDDQYINCYAICNGNDIFNNVVNKIFEIKPEFKEHGNFFLCNGNQVNEYKSLFENKIQDGDVIILIESFD